MCYRTHRVVFCSNVAACRQSLCIAFCTLLVHGATPVSATMIAVIGRAEFAQPWCELLGENGYDCVVLPNTGPTGTIQAYQVIVDVSTAWSDSDGQLADHVRAGRSVITWGSTPETLGIDTDPVVQAWIGANSLDWAGDTLLTTTTDPILGDLPVGTLLEDCADSFCPGLADFSGHPNVKVLARLAYGLGPAGILRNTWQGGQSAYFTEPISVGNPVHQQIILNTVRELLRPTIPAASHWGVIILGLLFLSGGSVLIVRRRRLSVNP